MLRALALLSALGSAGSLQLKVAAESNGKVRTLYQLFSSAMHLPRTV